MNREDIRNAVTRIAHREVSDEDFRNFVDDAERHLETTVPLTGNIATVPLNQSADSGDYRLPEDLSKIYTVSQYGTPILPGRADITWNSEFSLSRTDDYRYAIVDGLLRIVPGVVGPLTLVYRRKEPSLNAQDTNSYTSEYPYLYIYYIAHLVHTYAQDFEYSARMLGLFQEQAENANLAQKKKLK